MVIEAAAGVAADVTETRWNIASTAMSTRMKSIARRRTLNRGAVGEIQSLAARHREAGGTHRPVGPADAADEDAGTRRRGASSGRTRGEHSVRIGDHHLSSGADDGRTSAGHHLHRGDDYAKQGPVPSCCGPAREFGSEGVVLPEAQHRLLVSTTCYKVKASLRIGLHRTVCHHSSLSARTLFMSS